MAVTCAPGDLQLVTFFLGREEYGVDVMAVREIVAMPPVTRTVNAPPHVEGIVDLRGEIVPVVSLRRRLGLPPAQGEGCLAVTDCAGTLSGFVVDDVSDVIRVRREELLPPVDAAPPWVTGLLSLENRFILVMDLTLLA